MAVDLSEYYTKEPEPAPSLGGLDLSEYFAPEVTPEIEPEPKRTYLDELSGALSSGFRNMQAGLAATGFMAGVVGEEEVAVEFLETIRNQPETPEYYKRFLMVFEQEGRDVSEAEGVWDTTIATFDLLGKAMQEAIINPKATLFTITESLANSAPALFLAGGGAVGGGLAAGPPGAVGGLVGGTALGTFAVEAGAHLNGLVRQELADQGRSFRDVTEEDVVDILQSPEFIDWAETESIKRGLAVGAVEGVFAMFGGKLLSGAKGPVSAAVRGVADVGVETVGEMAGELLGQVVTEGPIAPGEVVLEGVAGAGQSVGTSLTGAAVRKVMEPEDSLDQAIAGQRVAPTEAIEGEDALDTVIRETTEPTVSVEDALDVAVQVEEVPEQTLQTLIESDPRLNQVATGLVDIGAIGDEVTDTLYQAITELPESVRSDADRQFVELYDAQEVTLGDQLSRAARQEPTAVVEEEVEFDDREAILGLVDDQLLGDSDRVFIADAARETLPVEELVPEREVSEYQQAEEKGLGMDTDSRLSRAKEMGFDTEQVWYHGTTAAFQEFEVGLDPRNGVTNAEIYFSDNPEVSHYATGTAELDWAPEGANIFPVYIRGQGVTHDIHGQDSGNAEVRELIAQAKKDGSDYVVLENASMPFAEGTELVVFDPQNIRSINSAFDPEYAAPPPEAPEGRSELQQIADEAATSPYSETPQPTEAQIEAGTYKKPKIEFNNVTVAIENPKDSVRKGVDPGGVPWEQTMQDNYGYILGSVGKDKDHVDVFIGPREESEKIFVVDQMNPETGAFDEHKVIFGANGMRQAKEIYNRNYAEGWQGMGDVTAMTQEEFKGWVTDRARTQLPAAQFKDPVTDQNRLRSVEGVSKISSITRIKVGKRPARSLATVDVTIPDSTETLPVRVVQKPDENWTIDRERAPTLTTPESIKAYTEFERNFRKQFPQKVEAKKAKKEITSAAVDRANATSSYEVDAETGTTDLFIEREMESEAQIARNDLEANPNNLRAKRKYINAAKRLLEQKRKIQEARASNPYFEKGSESIDKVADKVIATSVADMTVKERVSRSMSNFFDKFSFREFVGYMVTDIYGIEKWERQIHGERLSAEISPTALSHAARNAKVAAAASMNVNGLKLDEFGTGLVADTEVAPLLDVLEPVAKMGDKFRRRWEMYAVAQRSQRLIQEDRESLLDDTDIQQVLGWVEERPEVKKTFDEALEGWRKFNRRTLETAVDAGSVNREDAFGGYVIVSPDKKGKAQYKYRKDGSLYPSQEAADKAAAATDEVEFIEGWYQDDYVPFNRISDEGIQGPKRSRKIGQQRQIIKQLKGGEGQIPVIENMVQNTTAMISHTMNTIAMQQTVDMLKDVAVEELDDGGVPPLVDREIMSRTLDEMDIDIDTLSEPEIRRWMRFMQGVNPTADDTVIVYKNGKPKHYRVTDPSLLRAMKHIGPNQVKTWLQVLGFPTRMLSFAVTKMPGFIIRNFVREIQNAYVINAEGKINPLNTVAAAAKNMWRLSVDGENELNAMMARGMVSHNNYFDATPIDVVKNLKKRGADKTAMRRVAGSVEGLYRAYNKLAIASEHATRLKIRDDYLAAGHTQSEAEYQALDVLNHSRRGGNAFMEVMVALTPFLNPRIQGIDRLYRGGKQHKAAYFMKAAMMMAGATALAAWNWEENEEEMDALTEIEKDLYFHFWIQGQHWRIPKGFEVGQIAGTFPERVIEHIVTDEPEYISETVTRFLRTTMAIDLPQIVRPIAEVAMDYDSFSERSILGFGDQFNSPEEQFNTWTSEIAKVVANAMPDSAPEKLRSPKMVDHIIKGYTGPMGMWAMEKIDQLWEMTGNAPDSPKKKLGERDVIRNLYRGDLKTPSRHVQRFYRMMETSGRISADLKNAKENNIDKWISLQVSNVDKIGARSELNRYDTQMRKLNKRYNDILKSETITPESKTEELQLITAQRNRLAAEASELFWWAFK